MNTRYTVHLNDTTLQTDSTGKAFFHKDVSGKVHTVASREEAESLCNILYNGIPFNLFKLEQVDEADINRGRKYQIRIYLNCNPMVWCDDESWHRFNDIKYLTCDPMLFDSAEEARVYGDKVKSVSNLYTSVVSMPPKE